MEKVKLCELVAFQLWFIHTHDKRTFSVSVTVLAEAEDAAEDEIIPALESDPSTEDEDGVDVSEPSGKVNLAQLEEGVRQLAVNGNSREEDSLQPPEDTEGIEEPVWTFDLCANRLIKDPPWNLWSEELDIPDTKKNDVIHCLRMLTFSFFEKRSFRYKKRRRKIKNQTIVFIKLVVSLTIVNDDPSLTIINDYPSLTIVKDYPSLTIFNDDPSLTIVNKGRKPT